MRITELFTAQSIALDEAQQDRSQIIDRLVELQATHGNIRDKEAYKKGLYEREDEGSTYVDNGITVPHAKCDCVTRPSLAALRLKTLDNANVYTQVEYLSNVYLLTGDTLYRNSARRGMEYMLSAQYPNGGWRGWDADAVTFNDGIIYGVLSTWNEVLSGKPHYAWVGDDLKARIRASWDRGIDLILKTQWVQDGVKTVWAQQYDHETLQPVKARAYELPALSAGESADITMLLMRIKKTSPEVVEAVESAAAWFDRTKITGKKVVTVPVPEGLAEDRKIRKDRVVVDDPEVAPMWPRYSELSDNRPFFATREGKKVYDLREVPAERRVGYSWYGTWGNKVLKKYPEWLRRLTEKK